MGFLKPVTESAPRPPVVDLAAEGVDGSGVALDQPVLNLESRVLYLKSYLFMRAAIGVIGLAMPLVLVVGDGLLLNGSVTARGSLSTYYYSGVRDVFVGSLCAIAVFLITYKMFERNLDNTLSFLAGLGALVVALFPTARPPGTTIPATPLQVRLGEQNVSHIHYSAAAVFIVALGIMTFFFGLREGRRTTEHGAHRARRSPSFWRTFHWTCALLIFVSLAFIVYSKTTGFFTQYSLLVGEVIAIVAFGLSWLLKGLELNVLLGPSAKDVATRVPAQSRRR